MTSLLSLQTQTPNTNDTNKVRGHGGCYGSFVLYLYLFQFFCLQSSKPPLSFWIKIVTGESHLPNWRVCSRPLEFQCQRSILYELLIEHHQVLGARLEVRLLYRLSLISNPLLIPIPCSNTNTSSKYLHKPQSRVGTRYKKSSDPQCKYYYERIMKFMCNIEQLLTFQVRSE